MVDWRAAGVASSAREFLSAAGDRVRAVPVPVSAFVWTRLLVWTISLYAWLWWAPPPIKPNTIRDLGYATEIWSRADANWFISIAEHGYQRNGSAVFYPLYPLTVGMLGRVFGGYYIAAGLVISLSCCLGAFVLFYRLAVARIGLEGARRALLYLALFPMSLFLQAVYSESLYLLCALAAFVLAERRRWLGSGIATGLAMLTRLAGVALLPPILLLAWRSPERRRAVLGLAVAPALAALYPLWLLVQFHAPFAAVGNEGGWGRHVSAAGPLGGLWRSFEAARDGVTRVVARSSDNVQFGMHNLEYFVFLVVFVWLGIEAWRRFGAPYGLFVLGSLAIPLSAPADAYPLLSLPRFCLPLFPAFLALAAIATTPRRDRLILILSTTFLALSTVEWGVGQWVS